MIRSTRKPLPEPDPEFRFDPAGDLSAIAARELLSAISGADNVGGLNAAVTVGPEAPLFVRRGYADPAPPPRPVPRFDPARSLLAANACALPLATSETRTLVGRPVVVTDDLRVLLSLDRVYLQAIAAGRRLGFRFDPARGLSAIAARDLPFATCEAGEAGGANAVVPVGPEALLLVCRGYADAASRVRRGPRFHSREVSWPKP